MPRQYQHVFRQVAFQARQRTQIDAERVAFGVHGLHADIRGNPCEHLVGAQQQVFRRAEQHDLLGGVSATRQDLERAPADAQQLAGDEAAKRARQAGDHAQVAVAAGEQPFGGLAVEAVRAIEAAVGLGIERARLEMNAEADEILGLAHQQRQVEALAQPASETDVVG